MAIVKEIYATRDDGKILYRTYSDENFRIAEVETGYVYDEAIEIEGHESTYIEIDEKVEEVEE